MRNEKEELSKQKLQNTEEKKLKAAIVRVEVKGRLDEG